MSSHFSTTNQHLHRLCRLHRTMNKRWQNIHNSQGGNAFVCIQYFLKLLFFVVWNVKYIHSDKSKSKSSQWLGSKTKRAIATQTNSPQHIYQIDCRLHIFTIIFGVYLLFDIRSTPLHLFQYEGPRSSPYRSSSLNMNWWLVGVVSARHKSSLSWRLQTEQVSNHHHR